MIVNLPPAGHQIVLSMFWNETDEIHSTAELRDSSAVFNSKFVLKYYLVFPVCVAKQCVANLWGIMRILEILNAAHSVFALSSMTEFYMAVKVTVQLELV